MEICFPIMAINNYRDPDPSVYRRLGLCAAMLEENRVLRSITFNCDTNAFVGEHDNDGVELVARAFLQVLVRKREKGVKVKFVNTSLRRSSRICVGVFREAGFTV